jgi:uncharacterized protein YecT (DUF1311 family)
MLQVLGWISLGLLWSLATAQPLAAQSSKVSYYVSDRGILCDVVVTEGRLVGWFVSQDGQVLRQLTAALQQDSTSDFREADGEITVTIVGQRCEVANAGELTGFYRPLEVAARLELARKAFSEFDTRMLSAYADAAARCDEGLQARLRRIQQAWLDDRDTLAEREAEAISEGTAVREQACFWVIRSQSTAARLEYLKRFAAHELEALQDGVYHDGNGGTLILELRGAGAERKLAFSFSVLRGPTLHVGELNGQALPEDRDRSARFDDHGAGAGDPQAPCQISFVVERGRLLVEGKNTLPYHGVRAYFDGIYVYWRSLEPSDRETLGSD